MNRSTAIAAFALIASLSILFPACKGKDNTLAPPPPGPVWVTVQRPARPELLDNKINGFSIGGDGTVWIATDSGASTFNAGNWGYVKDSLRYSVLGSGGTSISYRVTGISSGIDGSIWFGLYGGGVKRYHPGSSFYVWQTYQVPDVPYSIVNGISSDDLVYGDIWVSTPILGVSRYIPSTTLADQGTWVTYTSTSVPQMLTNQVKCTSHDDFTNTVWFGSFMGAVSYNASEGWSNVVLPSDQSGVISAIGFDRTNNVWFGKNGGTLLGVTSYNKTSATFASYTNANTGGKLPDAPVNALITDTRTTRWIGTDAGLARFADTTWTAFNTGNTPEMPSDTITALVLDRKGNLWVGTKRGIAIYNPDGTRF